MENKSKSYIQMIVIVLAITILTSIVVYFGSNKTEFKITKEECRVDGNCNFIYESCDAILKQRESKDWNAQETISYILTLGMHKPVKFLAYCEKNKDLKISENSGIIVDEDFIETFCETNETCEKVEVEEIEIYDTCLKDRDNISGFDCTKPNNCYYGVCLLQRRKKQDLTLDWLEKNCEAIEFSRCKDLECENQEIYKWKCGKYFVEVNK